jgi:hypothetical protein
MAVQLLYHDGFYYVVWARVGDHFIDINKMIDLAKGAKRDLFGKMLIVCLFLELQEYLIPH